MFSHADLRTNFRRSLVYMTVTERCYTRSHKICYIRNYKIIIDETDKDITREQNTQEKLKYHSHRPNNL